MKHFFQKHAKIIMGLVSIMLMFVFAMPSFRAPNASERDTAVVGYLGKKKIINDDLQRANAELEWIRDMQLTGSLAWNFLQNQSGEDRDKGFYWMLLKEEAKKYEASFYSPESAIQYANEYGIKNSLNLSGSQLAMVFSDLDTVENYLQFLMKVPRPVSALELQADRELRKLQVWYLTLDAGKNWEQMAEPAEAQVQAQFDAYKGVVHTIVPAADVTGALAPADKDGHHFPFGYKYPDQVEVDYVVLDRKAVETLVTAKDDAAQKSRDLTAAYDDDFSKNPEKYKDKKWADVKDSLIKAQVDKRVSRRMKLMADAFMDRTSKAELAGVAVDYPQIVKELAKTSEFMGYEPQVKQTGLMGAEDLAKVEGIGAAYVHVESRNRDYPFGTLAVTLPELVKVDERDPIGLMKPKVGAEGPLLTDAAMNNYIYRVTKAVPTHEAKSVNEGGIRKQVVEDFKRLENYKQAVARMKALVKTAGAGDLEALAGQEKLPLSKPPEITRLTAVEFRNLANPDLEAVYGKEMVDTEKAKINFDKLKEAMAIEGFTDAAFDLANQPGTAEKRSGELQNESTLRCYVMQLQKTTPVSGEDFSTKRVGLIHQSQPEAQTFARDYMKQEALEKRLNWKPK